MATLRGPCSVMIVNARGVAISTAGRRLSSSHASARTSAAVPSVLCAVSERRKTAWYPVSPNQSQSV